MTGPELGYLFWPVLVGYIQIAIQPAVFAQPLSLSKILANRDELLPRPNLRVPAEGAGFWMVARSTLTEVSATGSLVSDAHLVTLMRAHGVSTIWSPVRDLRKFDGIRVKNPFTSTAP
ncbi:MAG: type II toxin-antitoxin system VapC family toxin [Candidatus Dormibacteria bacterium]